MTQKDAIQDSADRTALSGTALSGTALSGADFAAVDQLAAQFAERGGQPGVAYGVVAGGALVHSGGVGERWPGGPAPDAGTVFRIASMTKSFTATTVLLLRDQGRLTPDDLAEQYVPELAEHRLASPDAPRLTLRHLLTMTAGFPTDDPWGDRQQGLDPAEFAALLRGGIRSGWTPGTRFEYSNLGYAVLGRVIEKITGSRYSDAVQAAVLAPLGMASTGYEVTEFDPADVARGFQRLDGAWTELVPDGNGAFAPMGGVFTNVADLAVWVSGFADAFPPRDGAADVTRYGQAHPLGRASRREMQFPHAAIIGRPVGAFPDAATLSYGFGLFIEEDPVLGTVIQHSGGYPGYGSQMRWHPATGIGVIVLGNGTYSPAGQLAAPALAELVRRAGPAARNGGPAAVRGPAPGDGQPWPETLAARDQVDKLLADWDDAAADALFTPNVAWDVPYADRRAAIAKIRDRIGDFAPDQDRAAESDTPAHRRWWLRGEHGTVQVDIGMAPLVQARVQSLRLAVPPAPGSPLARFLDQVVALLNDMPARWPADLPVTDSLNTAATARRLRVGAAWAGKCALGVFRAGDGENAIMVELDGADGRIALTVAVDAAAERLRQADVTLLP
ncbi:MAG TPA: serine hydrolase domain-containing protein [Streptosporangiaceae bacterium]